MPRIIKLPPKNFHSEKEKRVKCKDCGASIGYLPSDVKSYHGTDYGGGPDGNERIVCPNCSEDIILRSW